MAAETPTLREFFFPCNGMHNVASQRAMVLGARPNASLPSTKAQGKGRTFLLISTAFDAVYKALRGRIRGSLFLFTPLLGLYL